jgi:hypothetical protein
MPLVRSGGTLHGRSAGLTVAFELIGDERIFPHHKRDLLIDLPR